MPECTEPPLYTLPPTPTPTATPVPTQTPKITDAWYQQRSEELFALLSRNGSYPSAEAVSAAVLRMEIDPDKPMVALTFDDGPTAGVTGTILDVLEKYNGRATFFIVGQRIAGNEQLLRRAAALGCELASHTWGHDDLKSASTERAAESLKKTADAIYETTGYTVRSLRPPKGESDKAVKELAGSMGLSLVFWSQSTHDYRIDSADKIARYVFKDGESKRELKDGDIVLLHDLRKPTAEAMEAIVSRLVEEGYQLVTVQELLQLSPDGFAPGKSYSRQ